MPQRTLPPATPRPRRPRILARRGEEVRAARMYARTLRLAGTGSLRRVRAEALREMDAARDRSNPAAGERRTAGR